MAHVRLYRKLYDLCSNIIIIIIIIIIYKCLMSAEILIKIASTKSVANWPHVDLR
jgi:hypothetical protein